MLKVLWLMLLELPFGLVMGFPEAMMPDGLWPIRYRFTRRKMKRTVNTTCAVANASDNAVEHHHCRIRSVAVDSGRASKGIIFPNGGWYRPFCGRNLSRVWISVGWGCDV